MSAALDMHDAKVMVDRCRQDPQFFVERVLGDSAWQTQVDIMESVRDHEETAVPSCHSSGKSWVAARIALWFLFSYHRSVVITTAPTKRQVEGILWKEIATAHSGALVPLGGTRLTTELKLDEDWYAMGFTAPDYDPNRFQGFHAPYLLVIVDEAAGITPSIDDQISSLMAGGHCRRLRIGNPVEAGSPFHNVCEKNLANVIHIDAFDTPNFMKFGIAEEDIVDGSWFEKQGGDQPEYPQPHLITPRWVAARFAEWGTESDSWRSRVRGIFPEIVRGAYWGELMRAAQQQGRITTVVADPSYPVHTAWDLGYNDKTAIWFFQHTGNQPRILGYFEHSGVGMRFYAQVLRDWLSERPDCRWGQHFAPHDAFAKRVGKGDGGTSIADSALENGIELEQVPRTTNVLNDIEAVRQILPRCVFDDVETKEGRNTLASYKPAQNARTGEFLNHPEHDWASDGADAFRYLAQSLALIDQTPKPTSPRKRRASRDPMTR